METTETRANTGVSPENSAPSSSQNRAPRRGISDAALRAAKPNDKPYKIAVGDGLYLEVKPSGSKLWRWKYRLLGKENRCSFGKYPNLTLKEARDAMEAARKLVKKGIHPAQQKQLDRLKASLEQANTFEAIGSSRTNSYPQLRHGQVQRIVQRRGLSPRRRMVGGVNVADSKESLKA